MRRSIVHVVLGVALVACGGHAPPPSAPPAPAPVEPMEPEAPPPAPPPPLTLGPITITVSESRTAQLFHVVDQMSAWGPAARRSPYPAWGDADAGLDAEDRAMLAKHAAIRHRRGWGGLDRAFDVDDAIDDAAEHAVEQRLLSQRDADDERGVLDRLAPKIDPLIEAQKTTLDAFVAHVRDVLASASPLAAELARFADVSEPSRLPVFLVADPSPTRGAGSFHDGILVVEVLATPEGAAAPTPEATTTFVHELLHTMLARRRESIAIAARKCDAPIDEETLTEGIAYALSPGILHASDRDPLAEMVARDEKRSLGEPFVRFERLGLALRSDLAAALDGGHETLHGFFPAACDAWAKVAKASGAKWKTPKRAKPKKKRRH